MTATSNTKTATWNFKKREKNQCNMTPSKDHSNLPVTKPTDMEICDLPEKEFKIAALTKFYELQ